MNIVQWLGLSLIIGSVIAMQVLTLKQNNALENG